MSTADADLVQEVIQEEGILTDSAPPGADIGAELLRRVLHFLGSLDVPALGAVPPWLPQALRVAAWTLLLGTAALMAAGLLRSYRRRARARASRTAPAGPPPAPPTSLDQALAAGNAHAVVVTCWQLVAEACQRRGWGRWHADLTRRTFAERLQQAAGPEVTALALESDRWTYGPHRPSMAEVAPLVERTRRFLELYP